MSPLEQEPRAPWFVGRPGTVLMYRVNRRPMSNPTLGGAQQPDSVMDHIVEVLHFGKAVVTGAGDRQREWILGNRRIFQGENALAGQIGWQRDDQQQASRYVPETQEWRDEVESAGRSAHAPFALDGNTRILAVLNHSTFDE